MVYVPKPYVVEVPKPVPYVKLQVPQQYHFEKQLSHPYKIEKPLYVHQLPTSLDVKVPIDFKTSEESPVSVTVEKQVLLPVNLGDEKENQNKQPSTYVSFPDEVTSHLKLAMNKEQSSLSEIEKESLLEQLNANTFSQENFKSQFLFQDLHRPSSLATESPTSWSTGSKTGVEPIVVSEESQKWTSFNGSEWVPRFRITDIKTSDASLKPEKGNFEIDELRFPFQNLKLSSEDISKYLIGKQNNFVPSPALEPATTLKQIPFEHSSLNEHTSKQSFEYPSSKTYQFYNIDSGNAIKPEALTSSDELTKFVTEQKDGKGLSQQWLISKDYQKDFEKTIPKHSEPNLRWGSSQEPYLSHNEPTKKWVTSNEKYVIRTEPLEQLLKDQEKYGGQKKVTQQWSAQDNHQVQEQGEPGKKWTNGHGQYIIQHESDNFQAQQKGQPEGTINWLKSGDQYISNEKPDKQWLKTEETQYTSHKQPFSIQEEQGRKVTETEGLFKNQKSYSSQQFVLSPQYATESKDTMQPQKYDQQDEKYFSFSQQLEGSFKPLIPKQSHISYKYQIPQSETQFDKINHPRLQQYNEGRPSEQQEQAQTLYKNFLKSQVSGEQSSLQTQGDQPSTSEMHVYHREPNTMVRNEKLQPTSTINYQQYFSNHQYYQQPTTVQPKAQVAHQIQESSVQSYPKYTSTPQRHGDYWQHTSQSVYHQNTGGRQDEPSSEEGYGDKSKFRQEASNVFGQKRRHRQPSRSESGVSDQLIRSNRLSTTNTTEEPTTSIEPSSTTSQTRRKHRRKQKRRNQETTISPTEK